MAATEEAMAATGEDTVDTTVAMEAMAMANEKCHFLVDSFIHVGRADRQNFVNIHSESLFCFLLCKFYAWEMHTSIMLLRVTHELQNTDKHSK